jgi:hypothetical protein
MLRAGLGSELANNTREPLAANCLAAAMAIVVRPVPPLPKNVNIRAIVVFRLTVDFYRQEVLSRLDKTLLKQIQNIIFAGLVALMGSQLAGWLSFAA